MQDGVRAYGNRKFKDPIGIIACMHTGKEPMETISERKQKAKEYRKTTSRSDLGIWKPKTGRKIVEELILSQEKTRVQKLIPIRRQRMAESPFTFFRGAAIIQAHDLAQTPKTPFYVQACGDAHISNFGIFASPERRMLFDINDFDETLPAPFEVDIKRLLASIEICGRDRKFPKDQREKVVYEAAQLYRETIHDFSKKGNMEVWYAHLDVENFLEKNKQLLEREEIDYINGVVRKALTKTSALAFEKLMETSDGQLRIKSNPPFVVPIRDLAGEEKTEFDFAVSIRKAIELYKESLPPERRKLIDQYEPLELAHKIVGVGSVGLQAWILAMTGNSEKDPLMLQIKEAKQSVLEEYYGASIYEKSGHRIVEGQRAIQTSGDILLGWLRLNTSEGRVRDFYVRQLWDAKGSFDLKNITPEGYYGLSLMCAWTLAKAHSKTGDRHAIAAYLGKNDRFEQAMVNYARAYADQNKADYEMFLAFSRDML